MSYRGRAPSVYRPPAGRRKDDDGREAFGISRKTGYKTYTRYKDIGVRGLTDRSRRPYRHANQLPLAVERLIVRLKKEYPAWGAPKLRERLRQRWPDIARPAISTVHAVLDRHGLVRHRRRARRPRLTGTALTQPIVRDSLGSQAAGRLATCNLPALPLYS